MDAVGGGVLGKQGYPFYSCKKTQFALICSIVILTLLTTPGVDVIMILSWNVNDLFQRACRLSHTQIQSKVHFCMSIAHETA